jgi:hypothetical protein
MRHLTAALELTISKSMCEKEPLPPEEPKTLFVSFFKTLMNSPIVFAGTLALAIMTKGTSQTEPRGLRSLRGYKIIFHKRRD